MDRAAARRFLGVEPHAEPADVLAAYDRTSSQLKQRVVEARTVSERNRAVRALRNLRALRDLALDPADIEELRRAEEASRPVLVDDWWQPDDGVPTVRDRAAALRWLGLGPSADRKTIRGILLARGRLLKQRIAQATSEYTLRHWQGKLSDFRRLSAVALPKMPLPPGDPEDTATESSTSR